MPGLLSMRDYSNFCEFLSLWHQAVMSGQTKWRQGQLCVQNPIHPALAWPHGKSRLTGDKQSEREREGVGVAGKLDWDKETGNGRNNKTEQENSQETACCTVASVKAATGNIWPKRDFCQYYFPLPLPPPPSPPQLVSLSPNPCHSSWWAVCFQMAASPKLR